ncbi:probable receptor-like protein kinase At5g39020 isoform X3 [Amaranthus tricolor]|uniref:probable receptor-like protein kinase At5g39020 isoform X3 n=1 Tax=Amaranthus tricolor TaxID=29722 RepID=UPI002585A96A|nr:probable receptor-like protein kinase At5g39020 isoform X3 [Amaranthus tricolor]
MFVHPQMLLTLLSFLFITTLTNSITTPYKPPDHLLINFGLPKNSPQLIDNRIWQSDQDFILTSLSATSNSTSKSTAKAVEVASTPYDMARIFRATTTYSIPVTTWGPKLVRLYFPPLSISYDIIDTKSSFLSLTINGFNILCNFSAFAVTTNANAHTNTTAPVTYGLVREIYISLDEGNGQKGLKLTFSPSNPDGFGFINGLEIISVPDGLYINRSGSNMVPYLSGFQDSLNNPFNLSDSIAMENIIRLNVGGSIVDPSDDSGLSRTWFGRDDDYMMYYDVLLNGLEIFKLSSSNGSLAAPNPNIPMNLTSLQGREHGLTKIMIIFIILGIGIGICMLIALILLYKKMNSLFEKSKEIETLLKQHGSLGPKRHTYADLKRITNSFKIKLGEGGYGIVYKGKLHCGDQVAVKILKRSSNRDMDMVEFINEVASIGNTNHKNIVKLLGFCYEGSKRALIYDYMPCGSLEKFTHGGRDENNQQLSWKSLFEIAIGIARGLEYLHQGCNTRILHFDIKPQNILLDENYCPKISDFGLAKICPQKDSIILMSEARGTAGYIAPEVFFKRFGGVSHKSDVYSYGMLVLEMVGCRKNIDAKVEHSSEQYFPHWIYKQLEEVEEIDQIDTTNNNEGSVLKRKMVVVSLWCIQTNPLTRPNMTRVVEMLEGTLDLLQIPPIPSLASPLRSHKISTTLDEISLGGLFVSSI